MRFRTDTLKLHYSTMYAPVDHEKDKVDLYVQQALKTASPKLRKAFLKNADRELILSIVDCALNVLNGNCKLSDCNKRKLAKFKTVLRALCKRLALKRSKS